MIYCLGAIHGVWRRKPAPVVVISTSHWGWLTIHAASQPLLLEKEAALSTFPATCSFPLHRASNSIHPAFGEPGQKTSPATWFGKPVLISFRKHSFSMRSGAQRQGHVFLQDFRLKSAQNGLGTSYFRFFPAYFRDSQSLLFHRALVKTTNRRGDSTKIGTRLYPRGQSPP